MLGFFQMFPVILLIILILLIIIKNVRVVQQASAYVIERLGAYSTTWSVGLHVKIPFIERVAKVVSLKEQVADFPPQPVITKDNVTMQIDTVVYFQITDPKLYTYGVEQPMLAIESLSATTLRNIIGDLDLDQCLTSRDIINSKMRVILDEATDPWGIKVHRVELKNIIPPREIQDAMEKQMKAERERRESILRAEGEKRAAILEAEALPTPTGPRCSTSSQCRVSTSPGVTCLRKRAFLMPPNRASLPLFSGRLRAATAPVWASASRMSTPGITGWPGKCPQKNSSLRLTHLRPMAHWPGS